MNCRILVPEATAHVVAALAKRYGLTLDEFARANLHFAEVIMPDILIRREVSPATEAVETGVAVTQTSEGFLADFCAAVLPTFRLRGEYHRVSALFEDTVLRLRAQRLPVEAFLRGAGKDLAKLVGERPGILGIDDPMRTVREDEQYITASNLELLGRMGKSQGYFHRQPVGPIEVDLNSEETHASNQRGVDIGRNDMARWLPVLHFYGFVPGVVLLSDRMSTEDEDTIIHGLALMLSQIIEGVCFFFSINPKLPQVDYRQDLLIIHHRARKIAGACEEALLQSEVALHQLNGHADLLTEKLLVLASAARPGEAIYGPQDAATAVSGARSERGAKVSLVVLTADDSAAFESPEC